MIEIRQKISLPEQRVSEAKKENKKHYIPTVDYWIDRAISLNNKNETRINLDAANGIIDEDTYKYVISPMTYKIDGETIDLPGKFRELDIITDIKEKNIGEYIQLPYKFYVNVSNSDSILLKNDKIEEEFYKYLEQIFINLMNQQQDTGIPSKELENPEEFIEKVKRSWFDDRAIQGQHILENINRETDFDLQRISLFFNFWATEEAYTYRYIKDGELLKDIISPLEGYPIANGEEFAEDYEGFLIRRDVSLAYIKNMYWDEMDTKEKNYILDLDKKINSGSRTVTYSDIVNILGRRIFQNETSTELEQNKEYTFSSNDTIKENIIIYVTENKKRIRTYINNLGDILEEIVDEDYEYSKEVNDIKVDDIWIEEVYKAVRIGDEAWGVYLKPKKELVQRYSNNGRVKLPIGGRRGLLTNNNINPIPRRLSVYQAMIRFLNLQQERAIAKYKGSILTIPKSMLDSDDLDPKGQYYYMLADGTLIYDDADIDFSTVAQGFRVVENPGLERWIKILEELKQGAKAEAWEISNMNNARAGQSNPYSSVRNNEQDLFRAKLGSELQIFIFHKMLERDHIADLEYSKFAYEDGKIASYFDDENTEIKFEIDPNKHFESEYGVYVTNSRLEETKLKKYEELAFAAAQNGDLGIAAKAIDAKSSVELSKYINKYVEERKAFEDAMAERQQSISEATLEKEERKEQLDREQRLDEIELKETFTTEREVLLKQMDISDDGVRKDFDLLIKAAKVKIDEKKQKLNNK